MTAFLVTDMTDAGASPAMIRALNGACVDRPAVTALSVEPSRAIMEVGARLEVAASVSDSQGTTLADRTLSWNTSDASIASVDRSGQIVARSPGLAVITAEVEASEGRVQVRVLPPTYSTSGVLATGLFLPGASQFRVKRPLRGALTILGTGGAIAWGLGAVETTQFCASPVGADGVCAPGDVLREETGRPNLVAGVAIGVGVMVLSAIDAALHGRSLTKEAERIRANPFGGGDGAGFGLSSDGSLTTSWRLRVR
jgi:hypothetical protein